MPGVVAVGHAGVRHAVVVQHAVEKQHIARAIDQHQTLIQVLAVGDAFDVAIELLVVEQRAPNALRPDVVQLVRAAQQAIQRVFVFDGKGRAVLKGIGKQRRPAGSVACRVEQNHVRPARVQNLNQGAERAVQQAVVGVHEQHVFARGLRQPDLPRLQQALVGLPEQPGVCVAVRHVIRADRGALIGGAIVDQDEFSYADEMLGKWVQAEHGLDDSTGNPFGIYIKQKVEKDLSGGTVSPKDAGFEDIEDTDPYYYIYEEAAGKQKKSIGDLDKARLYEEKYGSIFRAFSEVSQEEIIQAPVNQYSFVNAGPGTGKTYTLMKKVTYMDDNLEADPEGILVLCFTNAAVNEIKSRISDYYNQYGAVKM